MKGLLVGPEAKTMVDVIIENERSIAELIGYDIIMSDGIGSNGDGLLF